METYPSISDFLKTHGYKAEGEMYVKYEGGQLIKIHASSWAGQSVEVFIDKAKRTGLVLETYSTLPPIEESHAYVPATKNPLLLENKA